MTSERISAEALDFEGALTGVSVLVTGHTGFTGGGLALWLEAVGARVSGLALAPNTVPNLFQAGLGMVLFWAMLLESAAPGLGRPIYDFLRRRSRSVGDVGAVDQRTTEQAAIRHARVDGHRWGDS